MKEMVAFFLSKGIVKGGELIIYLFVYLFFAVTYFCWSVDVFVVIVVVAVCLFVFYTFFVLCCRPVFKQALHNKPPTHLGGNYFRIVIQPTDNCHNRDCGTSDS